jgi:hypothetical protein
MYTIRKDLRPPPRSRPFKRTSLDGLIELAKQMEVNDAIIVKPCDAQMLRIILITLGFECITDGYHCPTFGHTLLFKIAKPPSEPPLNWEI